MWSKYLSKHQDEIHQHDTHQLPERQLGYGSINHIYTSRFLQRAGNPQEDMLNKSQDSLNCIQWKLQKLLETLARNNKHFAGRLIGVGSYFEGVPFSGEELDFVYELESYIAGKHPQIVLLQEKNVNTFKPRENSDIFPATYFKIKYGNSLLNPRRLKRTVQETCSRIFCNNHN